MFQRRGGGGNPQIEKDRSAKRSGSAHPRDLSTGTRDYLQGLKWDGKKRLDTWLTKYFGVPASESRRCWQVVLISMVARVMEPGCKVDHVLTFVGSQGILKSTAGGSPRHPGLVLRRAAALHYDEKPLVDALTREVGVEMPELSAIRKADVEEVKNSSRVRRKNTPSYGRMEVVERRQCVFIATDEPERFLKDDTGDRRWWPVAIGELDVAALQRARDKLFAEAYQAYVDKKNGGPHAT